MKCNPASPFVSVIIPVLDNQEGLIACLEKMKKQSYGENRFEVVVIDNGSSPPVKLASKYPFRVTLNRCSKPGSYAARNYGVSVARGQVLAFTDSDCEPDCEWLKQGVAALSRLHDMGYVVGGDVAFHEPLIRTGTALYQYATGFQQRENIERKYFTATANMFCTKQQFCDVGAFNEHLFSCGDREWCWRANLKGMSICYEPAAIVRTDPRSSLFSALTQARRVAAGRNYLKSSELTHVGEKALTPHNSVIESIAWIVSRHDLSRQEKLKVFFAASITKLASLAERARLRLGGDAERR